MKIEVGESLAYSWLKHVKCCQIVQTNWKSSPSWNWENEEFIKEILKDLQYELEDIRVSSKNSTFHQTITQTEVDVLGISFENNNQTIYSVESAFHEAGLNYNGNQNTVEKVISKLVRNSLVILSYFGENTVAEAIFMSPKCSPVIVERIKSHLVTINDFFARKNISIIVKSLFNDDFNTLILDPILLCSGNYSDTSELFIRSYQLWKLFDRKDKDYVKRNQRQKLTNDKNNDGVISKFGLSELKVGTIAKVILRSILSNNVWDEENIRNFCNRDWSLGEFNITYPLLTQNFDEYDKKRFYADPIIINGNKYYLCSQWTEERNRKALQDFVGKHTSLL